MDFFKIKERVGKHYGKDVLIVYPDFKVGRSKDLMIRGGKFYAIWDEKSNLWCTDEYMVQKLIDDELYLYYNEIKDKRLHNIKVNYISDFSSGTWKEFKQFIQTMSDNAKQLDTNITFANTEIHKNDYISKTLNYNLEDVPIDNYNLLMSTLYDEEERDKIEWAIGAIIAGDSKKIQKFLVLYGEPGAGKSTILNIFQDLFKGYYIAFDANTLAQKSNAFATEDFKSNPLVAIQHDGDLSKIETNSRLNSIISHEEITINEKYKSTYTSKIHSFLIMATNKPVKITDAKSGLIRRLIDVTPSGRKLPSKKYHNIINQIQFELGGIANYCLEKYKKMGKDYYNNYVPIDMIFKTDVFFNYVENYYDIFREQDGVTLSQGYDLYKEYCNEALIEYKLPKYKFRDEIKNYFNHFDKMVRIKDQVYRNYYHGFKYDKFNIENITQDKKETSWIILKTQPSLLDNLCKNNTAQYAGENKHPKNKWCNVNTKLKDIDTSKLHYVKLEENHIVIDFDIKNKNGEKDLTLNIEAANNFPPTYTEVSQGGSGLHLHYIYKGDVNKLVRLYSKDIEIKVFVGDASLRRKLSSCNDLPIYTLSSGLPLKGEKMINFDGVKNEQMIRNLIKKNLRKEIHPGTKPSIDFIHKILEDSYESGIVYDVSDMKMPVLNFASSSTNQSEYCLKLVNEMKFKSETIFENITDVDTDKPIVFFDVEVFPNLFVVCWKVQGENKKVVQMINPSSLEIENLLKMNLVGYNCRRYDNHILYARYLGYNNDQLFKLSQGIIKGSENKMFREAYNISYTDIYEFSSSKKSLKKWQIELGLTHKENHYPWDEYVDPSKWNEICKYCANDVITTEQVFNHIEQDFIARQILSELSGLSMNDTTQRHAEKIIFGDDPNPQSEFIYTDLSTIFPGYKFDAGKSYYRDEIVGEGGYVDAKPGVYLNVDLLDIASMHPTSAIELKIFGKYTKVLEDLKQTRLYIKHGELDKAKNMFDGKISKFLNNPKLIKDLSYSLKIVINIIYGMTSAKFPNKFKDPRNIDNIVAKRGALFMIDLKHAINEMGYEVVHIKTDSVKIANSDEKIRNFIIEYGKKYGYEFEYEARYEKICLVNDAVYIAYDGKEWTTVGAQFQHPYIYGMLFNDGKYDINDLKEIRSVTSSLYLDFGTEENHDYNFVGKIGAFYPVNNNGGYLVREKDGKYYAVTGTKGYKWREASEIIDGKDYNNIDFNYYEDLKEKAISTIAKFDHNNIILKKEND